MRLTTQEEIDQWENRLSERYLKKYHQQGRKIFVRQMRILNTICEVERKLQGIGSESLDLSLSIMHDSTDYSDFPKRFESMLITAQRNPNEFADELYHFYMSNGRYITERHLYRLYFEFLVYLENRHFEETNTKLRAVYEAYLDIVLQQGEYLQEDKFAFNTIIAGITTDGELITRPDPFPDLDVPLYEIRYLLYAKQRPDMERIYKEAGYYDIRSVDDLEKYTSAQQIYNNNISMMVGYINEYTQDLIPERPMTTDSRTYRRVPKIRDEFAVKDILTRRHRMLPANGVRITFQNSFYREIRIKEVYRDDRFVMLFRISSRLGDFSGRYDTLTQKIYTPLQEILQVREACDLFRSAVLWCYAACVCDNERAIPSSASYRQFISEDTAELTFFSLGVKQTVGGEGATGVSRLLNPDRYETTDTSVNGMIRHLPEGQKASAQAKALAQSLGFELAENETFVRPHTRRAWILKGNQ